MKCKSTQTNILDGYRAGVALGESLKDMMPEAVILFPSVHYSDEFEDLFEGLFDALGTTPFTIGGTGDGFYEGNRVESIGVAALGLSSGGKVNWSLVTSSEGAVESPLQAGQQCAERLRDDMKTEPDIVFTFAPMICDGTKLTQGIRKIIKSPCVGALTGDDRQFVGGAVLANGKMLGDQVAMLGLNGDVSIHTRLSTGQTMYGHPGIVEKADGAVIYQIDGIQATEFLQREMGVRITDEDLAVTSLAYHDIQNQIVIRTPNKYNFEDGSIRFFGSIPVGTKVWASAINQEDMLDSVRQTSSDCTAECQSVSGALIISCAGRKWLLGEKVQRELDHVREALPPGTPLIGLPSFGEIGPVNVMDDGNDRQSCFHNLTFVLTLFGDS